MTTGTIGAVGYGFGYVFTLWPLIVLSPVRWKRENVLAGMIIAWSALLFGWLFATSISPRPLWELIPEPINTWLFFLTGFGLLAFVFLREVRRQRLLHILSQAGQNAAQVLEMSIVRFEDLAVELYRSLGYRVRRLGSRSRMGGDILLCRDEDGTWLVQCRGWHGPVNEEAVQQFWDEVQRRQADGGILITTGVFTRQARQWAEGKRLSLMEGNEFLQAWRRSRAD